MADLTNTYFAANYRRATLPFYKFGTRELTFYIIYAYNDQDKTLVDSDQVDPPGTVYNHDAVIERQFLQNSIAAGIIQSIQQIAEIYAVGSIDVDSYFDGLVSYFTVVVAHDTYKDHNSVGNQEDNTSYSEMSKSMYGAVDEYLNSAWDGYDGADVQRATLNGDYLDWFGTSSALSTPSKEQRASAFSARKASLRRP
jgi:hypothetical protein